MNFIDNAVNDVVKKVKNRATILRLLSDLDNVVFTIYTNKAEDEVVVYAKVREGKDELE